MWTMEMEVSGVNENTTFFSPRPIFLLLSFLWLIGKTHLSFGLSENQSDPLKKDLRNPLCVMIDGFCNT